MLLSGQMFDQGCYSGGNWAKHDFGGVTMNRWVGKLNLSLGYNSTERFPAFIRGWSLNSCDYMCLCFKPTEISNLSRAGGQRRLTLEWISHVIKK